jgi:sigma-E factor negative regulatory protein RseC
MIDASGTIVALEGEAGEFALVSIDADGCGRCHEPGGCGGGANIGKMFCRTPTNFRALNPQHAAVGARVRVAIVDGAVRRSALAAYALPVLAVLAGAIGGSAVAGAMAGEASRDACAIVGALAGLVGAWLLLWRGRRNAAGDATLQPVARPYSS